LKNSTIDDEFKGRVTARVLAARIEFFDFMKTFTADLQDLALDPEHGDWSYLSAYFEKWSREKTHWGKPAYEPEGTRPFENFNQLLPLILLAVIDEVARRPERLDASPHNPDGSPRPAYRRSPRYLFSTPFGHRRATDDYDDDIALRMEAPWPSMTTQYE
jgi:hypothetical protein